MPKETTVLDGGGQCVGPVARPWGTLGWSRDLVEPFSLSRVDPQSCYLRIGEHRIDGVPLFDARLTGPDGVEGNIGSLGSNAEIALVESKVGEPGESSAQRPDAQRVGSIEVAEARHSRHKAVVVLTRGVRPGLYLLNASNFLKPFGPPAV